MFHFSTELVEKIINSMSLGKAPGIDEITAEHLRYAHPLLYVVLSRLFNLFISAGVVPDNFCISYTVPLLKGSVSSNNKSLCVDDFRGISISPVISKAFEHCILKRYCTFLLSNENQFGFKKNSSCNNAIFTLRKVVDHFVNQNTTVNICTLDLSKAFDKMNHHALFLKLIERNIPVMLLRLIEFWFENAQTCVRWDSFQSVYFSLQSGVRQGGVLSPYLFALYIDTVICNLISCKIGCHIRLSNLSILVYADDIILISPSVTALQHLLTRCEIELRNIDMYINSSKSFCLRIGPQHHLDPRRIVTLSGVEIIWSRRIRYLGVFIIAKYSFSCSLDHCKRALYIAFNSIYSKIGGIASEEIMIRLFKTKCLPRLTYALDVIPLNKTQFKSLNFAITSCLMKIFKTKSAEILNICTLYFDIPEIKNLVESRRKQFFRKYSANMSPLYRSISLL